MNTKHERAPIRKGSLENEVILAVVILYAVISTALLLIHHLQPADAVTITSSTSPSHDPFDNAPAGKLVPAEETP